jgi:hypothetical protein
MDDEDNIADEECMRKLHAFTDDFKKSKIEDIPDPFARNLVSQMLVWNPAKRIKVDHIVLHPFVTGLKVRLFDYLEWSCLKPWLSTRRHGWWAKNPTSMSFWDIDLIAAMKSRRSVYTIISHRLVSKFGGNQFPFRVIKHLKKVSSTDLFEVVFSFLFTAEIPYIILR